MGTKKNDVIDIDLSVTKKKRFRIDKDNDRILELNTSDMTILSRLQDIYPKLEELGAKATTLDMDEDGVEILKEIDKELREHIDYIFDSNVSEICAPDGSMYDLFNGQFRFEHILNVLTTLYEDNIERESSQLLARMRTHTDKYVKK